jgi:U3 small nucleolar RNA-associated protein 19
MPFLEMDTASSKKRKRSDGEKRPKAKKPSKAQNEETESQESQILQLEAQVLESRKHYNNIVTLISIAKENIEASLLASVSLCRVYCRLYTAGNLAKSKDTTESELVIILWLKARLNEYVELLLEFLESDSPGTQTTALTLLMRLVKEEVNQQGPSMWGKGIFSRALHILLSSESESDDLRQEFRTKYFNNWDDVRFYTLDQIPYVFSSNGIERVC